MNATMNATMNTYIMHGDVSKYLVGCITCHYHWLNEVDTGIKELRRIIYEQGIFLLFSY